MELSKSASALGLYRYNCEQPESGLFNSFFSTILQYLESAGITPMYVGCIGKGYSGKLTRFGGRTHSKLLKSQFAGIHGLTIAANPPESDAPTYDSFATAMLGYLEPQQELVACVVIHESFIKLRSTQYDQLLRSLIALCPWDFGYGFSASIDKHPDYHILGMGDRNLSAEESTALRAWYQAPEEVRVTLIRDVYPYNILNETQLNNQASAGVTLRKFAEQRSGCSLTQLTDYGLYLWQVPDSEIDRVRKALAESPALISRQGVRGHITEKQ